ncbi:HNH endonuclease [Isoptericola variabilis]|nr:HNH endonuclease [Isoptericola variabilis]
MTAVVDEWRTGADRACVPDVPPPALTADEVRRFRDRLLAAQVPTDATAQVELLTALEELRRADMAVQASVALELDETVRAGERAAARGGRTEERLGRGVPLQVGLATRTSPHRARVFLGAARVWHTEMPCTLAALRAGVIDEYAATVLVRETACLPLEARRQVDRELCADHGALDGVGVKRLVARARTLAARLDPAAVVARARKAETERTVTVRPAPDAMVYLTALLPVAQGVAAYAALKHAADTAPGDASEAPRPRGQVMADTLVERLTGRSRAADVPVAVNLVVSDATLLGAGHEPAQVLDHSGAHHGVVPAQIARELVACGLDEGAAWIRQLYADPAGRLVAATSARRFFADGLAALLRVRDQGICRTPYCDAPVRHLDHVVVHARGGATSLDNGQGLCEACNQAKNVDGFAQRVEPGGRHSVVTTTPTGHSYRSTAPPPPEPARPAVPDPVVEAESLVERAFERLLARL